MVNAQINIAKFRVCHVVVRPESAARFWAVVSSATAD